MYSLAKQFAFLGLPVTLTSFCQCNRFVKNEYVCIFVSGHINNLYNTVFWALVQKGGLTTAEAEDRLKVRANIYTF